MEVRRGLSETRLNQHFRRDASGWRIDERLREMVRFNQTNLTGVWPLPLPVDLVLLRNVLIYMSQANRQSILDRMQTVLHPEGCLMLGSTELGKISGGRCMLSQTIEECLRNGQTSDLG
jgi:chemotaxis protein methyltransferase CheR